jgi:putative hemolysin
MTSLRSCIESRPRGSRVVWRRAVGAIVALILAACAGPGATPTLPPAATPASDANLPNPASVFCEQQGYRLEMRTAADGSQSGVCVFPDGAECDEWAFYRGECGPATTQPPGPAVLPTLEGGTSGWQTYTQNDYGFAFHYPPGWQVRPDDDPVSTLYGHALFVEPAAETEPVHLRIVFRRGAEDVLLWPTGTGEGGFIERDTVPCMGGWLRRVVLVCQGQDMAVWYRSLDGAEIRQDNVEFSFMLSRLGTCAEGVGLSPDQQAIANMIVASLEVSPAEVGN